MNKKNQRIRKRFAILFIWGFILCSAFPGSTAEKKHKNEPSQPQADTLMLETISFRLAPMDQKSYRHFPLFTLTNNALNVRYPNFPNLQKKEENPPQILKNVPKKSKQLETSLYTASLLTLAALNVADYISTVKALQLPGLEEGNPIMRPITKNIPLFSAVKLGITALDFYLLKKIHKKNKTLGWILSIAGNFAMSYVVANNIRKIQSVTKK
jgi:hypothetical protein